MLKKSIKGFIKKVMPAVMKSIPVITTMMLVISSNSTSSTYNGQPEVPAGLKKYRKF